MEGRRATRALIHITNLQRNVAGIRKTLPEGTKICASVKAEAYGHGAETVRRILRDMGVEYLGVATPWEGEMLRRAGDDGPIILYSPSSSEEIPITIEAGLQPMVTDEGYLEALAGYLGNQQKRDWPVHLKMDTGMGRVGCRPQDALQFARTIDESPLFTMAGLATHFPTADSQNPDDMAFTRSQTGTLLEVAEAIRAAGINPGIIHAANSGGIALHAEDVTGEMMVRPGIALYGYGPVLPVSEPQKPVMELRTRITALKKVEAGTSISYGRTWRAPEDTWIATLPLGYADGYSRLLSNKAEALAGGTRVPIVGTVCMDQCMVNLGPDTEMKVGDEVILFGPDPAGPDAEEIAGLMGTISYEVTCGISARVPRIVVD